LQILEIVSLKSFNLTYSACYMNSFLQSLYQMKEFREALMSFEDSDFLATVKEDGSLSVAGPQKKLKLGIYQLQRLFA